MLKLIFPSIVFIANLLVQEGAFASASQIIGCDKCSIENESFNNLNETNFTILDSFFHSVDLRGETLKSFIISGNDASYLGFSVKHIENGVFSNNNFASLFIEKSTVKNLLFVDNRLSQPYLSGIFVQVQFRGNAIFEGSLFNIKIINSSFHDSELKGLKFENCLLENTVFVGSRLDRVFFKNCDMKNALFINATLRQVVFENVTNMRAENFINSDLIDVIGM